MQKLGCRVLIVEDQLLIALDLRRMLESLGCVVLGPAPSVEKALALLEEQTPDIALLDEDLKGIPAVPVAQALTRRRIPYVIISGYEHSPSDEDVLVKAARVRKPASVSALSDALDELWPS